MQSPGVFLFQNTITPVSSVSAVDQIRDRLKMLADLLIVVVQTQLQQSRLGSSHRA
jgi:hypothetical protein